MAHENQNQNYPALTGIRAIAAQMVFMCHFAFPSAIKPEWLAEMEREFHVGVVLFFVLSGFLITHRYLESSELTKKHLLPYFWARFARVYPIYLILTVLTYLLVGPFNAFDFWTNITLTKSFFNAHKMSPITQAWSLTVEECFYFSAPLIFWSIKHRLAWLPFVVIPLAGAVFLQWNPFPETFPQNNLSFALYYTYFGRAFEFLAGVLAAAYFNSIQKFRATFTSAVPVFTVLGFVLILGAIYFLSVLTPDLVIENELGVMPLLGVHTQTGFFVNSFALPMFVALFYVGLILESSVIKTFLASRAMILAGQASYAFYLLQHFALGTQIRTSGPAFYILICGGLWLCATLLYFLFEKPVRALILRRV